MGNVHLSSLKGKSRFANRKAKDGPEITVNLLLIYVRFKFAFSASLLAFSMDEFVYRI